MKTAISIPDDVFVEAERLAELTKKSRSQLYADALREYLLRHHPDAITKAINRTCEEVGDATDAAWVTAASIEVLRRTES